MKRNAIISLASVLILSVAVISGCGENEFSIETPSITIEHMNHSIKNDDGEVLATIYFDKPVLFGESDAIIKINEYFDSEYTNWLDGKQERLNFYHTNSMNLFLENVNNMRDSLGDDTIAEQPFQYTVDSEMIFLSNDVLSIKQYVNWFSGGPSDFNCYGSTFDLKTGELLPFTYFYNVDADNFRNSLANFLIERKVDSFLTDSEITQIIGANSEHNFNYEDDGHQSNLEYEYCYDGTSIYLTLNQISNSMGYSCGAADGIAGKNTMSGIAQFQAANSLGQGYLGGEDWYFMIK